ncbi:putative addiction module antidote protein family protein (plasmid) [Phaeobacter piscinae]|uniref:Addiction module antidote protein family protein n=1 Tax=Phaeobacter piscinae TaxID=1580596 RepID=A0AAN1GUQ3_9RHOB|nr:type II toxin-antitoxin system ParD family antitoxin [Phaeobacter piscinae]ATG45416.1 putative addiction module antidote protein family protein [Phaeobacter piscinae]AUQ76359.1 putative addiction module antidote protein family protein [Phaeobacter piscinae]AUR37978.1 putative addiction module antidote protein family protein [Phaeobacter piscinae]
MSVKSSISLTKAQDDFARALVAEGRYSSLSAVLQQGLELLREETEARRVDTAALRALIAERRDGAFVSASDGRQRTADLLARKRMQHDLPG